MSVEENHTVSQGGGATPEEMNRELYGVVILRDLRNYVRDHAFPHGDVSFDPKDRDKNSWRKLPPSTQQR
jgi:hypothetical protein